MKLLGLFGLLELVVLTQVADGKNSQHQHPLKPCPPGHTHQLPDTSELESRNIKFVFDTKCSECDRTMEELIRRLECSKVPFDSYIEGEGKNKKSGKCPDKSKPSLPRPFPSVSLDSICPITAKPKMCPCVVTTTEDPATCPCSHTHYLTQDLMDHPEKYMFKFGCRQCDNTLKLVCEMKNKEKNVLKLCIDGLAKKILRCWS